MAAGQPACHRPVPPWRIAETQGAGDLPDLTKAEDPTSLATLTEVFPRMAQIVFGPCLSPQMSQKCKRGLPIHRQARAALIGADGGFGALSDHPIRRARIKA